MMINSRALWGDILAIPVYLAVRGGL
ncbi:hypothetical protein XNC1_1645 [Xenorhabdus nematophila ATCC 19061]|uniref:Uncharacterized protein n=1 Tax=Xenorhabdus nematophila (strain ATCC 19061 / DSM 3370 / CCUG 14189 / LMG 1036 / NCIMB 9965 / AN6) TaxID=406817 RepID=D3VC54_XENNA|nr:hypothetical protein XNC1_1645 [Xenorhabdus nematophila ATCC 19061]